MNLTFPCFQNPVRANTDSSLFPGIVTARLHQTWDFYTTHLGFHTIEERGCSIMLAHENGARLAILQEETDGYPAELIGSTGARGLWLNLEVDDVAGLMAELSGSGIEVAPPSSRFDRCGVSGVVRDPNGVLIFLMQAGVRRKYR